MAPDSFVYVRTIEQGNAVRWYGINADIDDRKRAGQKLQEDEPESARDLQTPQAKESLQRALCDYSCPVGLHEPLNKTLDIVAAGGLDAIRS